MQHKCIQVARCTVVRLRKDPGKWLMLWHVEPWNGWTGLKTGARYQLNQIAGALDENDLAINVVGHTDDARTRSEQYPTNWELSSKRAVMVARYLTEVAKVDEKRIFVSAHSFHQAVRPNDTSYNRALNRRVEIILIKQKPYGSFNN